MPRKTKKKGSAANTHVFDNVTVRFWYGGQFKHVRNGEMVYKGGSYINFDVDPDELCYWDLRDYGSKCGLAHVDALFYQMPGLNIEKGLRVIQGDAEVLEMGKLAVVNRSIVVYAVQFEREVGEGSNAEVVEVDVGNTSQKSTLLNADPKVTISKTTGKVLEKPPPKLNKRKKLTTRKGPQTQVVKPSLTEEDASTSPIKASTTSPKKASITLPEKASDLPQKKTKKQTQPPLKITSETQPFTQNQSLHLSQFPSLEFVSTGELPDVNTDFNDEFEWEDDRPESPLKWNELVADDESSDDSDPLYDHEYQKFCEGGEFEDDDEDDFQFEVDESIEKEKEGDFSLSDIDLEGEGEDLEQTDFFEDESDDIDDEIIEARDRVKRVNTKLLEIVKGLQEKVCKEKEKEKAVDEEREFEVDEERENSVHEEVARDVNLSDCDEDNDIDTPPGSSDELEGKKGELVSHETDFSKFHWKVGQRFANASDIKDAVTKYAVLQGRDLKYSVSWKNRQRLGVKCVGECPFYLYFSVHSRDATWLVKRVVGNHTCNRNMNSNRQLKSSWVARQLLDVFKARPHWPAKEIVDTVRRSYRMIVSRDFAYKVKYHAHKMLHGSMKEHYMKVERYLKALKEASLETVLDLVVAPQPQSSTPMFSRMFTCFDGVKQGWTAGCRRVISVDAAFLKTFLGGQILTAVSRDPNEQMFPICWAVVEGENNLSWEWFFNHLKNCLDLGQGEGIAIISDEHQAILHAVSVVLPKAEHRHCARHIFALWHRTYKGDEMKLLFWKIAKAYNQADFNEAMDELRQIDEEAALAITRYNPQFFCRAFLQEDIKSEAITNNMAETFNAYIINARTKHIIYMLEEIRVALMQRLVKKRHEMEKWTSLLCPRIQARLEKEKEKAADCEVLPSSVSQFNVRYYLDQLNVDLVARTCSCRKWNMVGIPCCHAIACIYFVNQEPEVFVDECYKVETYKKAYSGCIPPCEGERYWPRCPCNLDPPPIKIGPGRPRKNRIKHPLENPKKPGSLSRAGVEMTCSICKKKGHNKRGCKDKDSVVPDEPAPKRPKGRPRKTAPSTDVTSHAPSTQATPTPTLTQTASSSTPATQFAHHTATAQPTQLGRGGRMILGGQGARSVSQSSTRGRSSAGRGSTTTSRGRGRGRGRAQPSGIGIMFADDGSPIVTAPSTRPNTRSISQMQQ
ncbi:uncharacterized protein LOC110709089 [Chenopodium quinoa]|uniref:uncharacterized protein LOC110709089 n=3 Tax=Chenopodium quinoa TaxID=63459 RepID=UPI000B77F93D|nr:uncharacterized protein LOC110709089 [Chenopodium quinoa]